MKVSCRICQGKLLCKIVPETQKDCLKNLGVVKWNKPFKNRLSHWFPLTKCFPHHNYRDHCFSLLEARVLFSEDAIKDYNFLSVCVFADSLTAFMKTACSKDSPSPLYTWQYFCHAKIDLNIISSMKIDHCPRSYKCIVGHLAINSNCYLLSPHHVLCIRHHGWPSQVLSEEGIWKPTFPVRKPRLGWGGVTCIESRSWEEGKPGIRLRLSDNDACASHTSRATASCTNKVYFLEKAPALLWPQALPF